jgi:replicative DNA helicase
VTSIARRLKTKANNGTGSPIDLIVVDYLQIMPLGERIENSVAEITKISNAFKRLAKELEVPLIALSQLSKEGYRKGPSDEVKAPSLADLKGSGSIEADADAVLLLSRGSPASTQDSREPQLCKVRIEKNRSGPQGMVELIWRGEFTRFYDPSVKLTETKIASSEMLHPREKRFACQVAK